MVIYTCKGDKQKTFPYKGITKIERNKKMRKQTSIAGMKLDLFRKLFWMEKDESFLKAFSIKFGSYDTYLIYSECELLSNERIKEMYSFLVEYYKL